MDKQKGLPIFFIHRGGGDILKYVLNQARFYNPTSDIYLLGDASNVWVEAFGVKHYLISDYFQLASEFQKVFVNFSPNGEEFERFCFQRWMVLNEFLTLHQIDGMILYLDTDAMLYTDITKYALTYLDNFDFTVCAKQGPQYTFFRDRNVLEEMCRFMYDQYGNAQNIEDLQKFYQDHYITPKKYGGICDMVIMEWFAENRCVLDTNVERGQSLFDNSVNKPEGFIYKGRIKKIHFDGKYPYGFTSDNHRKVWFLGLHFQGKAKWKMYRYYTGEKKCVPSKCKATCSKWMFDASSNAWRVLQKIGLTKNIKKIFKNIKPLKP